MQLRPLRIALIAPPWFEVPPRGYGGIEMVCHSLMEGLTERGHEVFLIGAGAGPLGTTFLSTFDEVPQGLGGADAVHIEALHAVRSAELVEQIPDLDVVHDHSLVGPLLASNRTTPTVVTAHGPVTDYLRDYFRALGDAISFVAISQAQRAAAPDLPWAATIHNGIPVQRFPFSAEKEDFLLFLGRIHPQKGTHLAIDAARAAGLKLVMAAKCTEVIELEYFRREIEPRLGPDVEWLGQADAAKKKDLLSRARGLLFPITWDEPFGLVLAEAMACGTPVIALARGSVPEIIVDGVTGIICHDATELPDAIGALDRIDPLACRRHARANFDAAGMVGAYEALFESLAVAPLKAPAALADISS